MAQIKKTSRVEAEILELIEPEIQQLGYQLWDLLWIPSQRTLRVFVSFPDPQQSVTLSDCQRVSHRVDGMIEASQILRDRYYLEVSSLGETPYIRTWVQLARFKDRKLEFTDLEGKKRTGVLDRVDPGGNFVWHLEDPMNQELEGQIEHYQRIRAKK